MFGLSHASTSDNGHVRSHFNSITKKDVDMMDFYASQWYVRVVLRSHVEEEANSSCPPLHQYYDKPDAVIEYVG